MSARKRAYDEKKKQNLFIRKQGTMGGTNRSWSQTWGKWVSKEKRETEKKKAAKLYREPFTGLQKER